MRFIFLICFLSGTVFRAFSQEAVVTVLDAVSGEALPEATVSFTSVAENKTVSLSADKQGVIRIAVQTGVTSYIFRAPGYHSFYTGKLNSVIYLSRWEAEIEEVIVKAIRKKTDGSNLIMDKKDISAGNLGQDLPILLNMTPSAVTYSDAGNGVGYTGIRIRGIDPSRINVTVNGIPLNDAESQGVYWVDLPDAASSVENIQIQRGVGNSTNGTAAFGSSINIQTTTASRVAYGEINLGIGYIPVVGDSNRRSTEKYNVRFGTGLIGKWAIDGRLSKIHSDGYVNNSASDLKSYYLSATRIGSKSILKLVHFSGSEVTGQAWNGIPQDILFGVKDSSGNYINKPNRIYNEFTYKNQTDNYKQDHYQAFYSVRPVKYWLINAALHYTAGKGYYEEYKSNAKTDIYDLGIDTSLHITNTDLVRRRWLDNIFYGTTFSAIYSSQGMEWTTGGSWNEYDGKHLGEVIWARYAGSTGINHPYYKGRSKKRDLNIYSRLNYRLSRKLSASIDLQVRQIGYRTDGVDDNYNVLVPYNFNLNYNFFNPKAGISYQVSKAENVYINYGMSSREPVRSDIIGASHTSLPKPEHMQDIEAGYTRRTKMYQFGANIYYMYYNNQLVNDGSINDVGIYNRVNVPKSYRAGIELMGSININKMLQASGNLTLSSNKILSFNEYIDVYDSTGNWQENRLNKTYKNVDLSLSPNKVASLMIRCIPVKNLNIDMLYKYVDRQYLDNTQSDDRALHAYSTFDIRVNYQLSTKEFKYIRFGLLLNNVTNTKYEPNGYTYGSLDNRGVRTNYNYYYPQAGFNMLAQITLGF